MSKKYGSYSDEDLNEWERFPWVFKVLGSSAMGAWLYRRQGNIEGKTIDRVLEIIDKEIEESKNDSDNRHLIHVRLHNVKGAVLALKGGEQE